jgi:hypothetical protein
MVLRFCLKRSGQYRFAFPSEALRVLRFMVLRFCLKRSGLYRFAFPSETLRVLRYMVSRFTLKRHKGFKVCGFVFQSETP